MALTNTGKGLLIAPETTAGTKATTGFVGQIADDCTINVHNEVVQRTSGMSLAPAALDYSYLWADGEIGGGWSFADSISGVILEALGNESTLVHTIGDGTAPDTETVSIRTNWGGWEYTAYGAVLTGITLTFSPDDNIKWSCPFVAQSFEKEASPSSISHPAQSNLAMPSDIASLTIGGTAIGFREASLTISLPYSDPSSRRSYGGSSIRLPRFGGSGSRVEITGSITVDLDDETGFDSVAVLEQYLAGTDLGAIAIGDKIALTNCVMTGDWAALQRGDQTVPINFSSESAVDITTTA